MRQYSHPRPPVRLFNLDQIRGQQSVIKTGEGNLVWLLTEEWDEAGRVHQFVECIDLEKGAAIAVDTRFRVNIRISRSFTRLAGCAS